MKWISLALAIALLVSAGCSAPTIQNKSGDTSLVWFEYTRQVDLDGKEKTALTVYPLDRAPVRNLAREPLFEYEKTVRSGITKVSAVGVAERAKIVDILKEYELAALEVQEKTQLARMTEIDRITQQATWYASPARRDAKRDDDGRWLIRKLWPF